ncbi:hypothetical protein IQ289_19120 [Burkholderia sp. R-70006]|nr:hypothetical protein [Burkholderia sp. R-70006]
MHLSIYDQTPEAASGGDANTAAARRCTDADPALTTRLARAVFLNPAADWTPCGAAAHVGMTIGALKTQLFREGSALTATVREQRLMRALLELLTPPPAWGRDMGHLAVQVGLTPHARLDEIFLRHFGCCAAQLARLSWCPALTWSIAPTLHLIH